MKPCIYCAEPIQDAARICRFCGKEQEDKDAERVLFEGTVPHKVYLGSYLLLGLLSLALVGLPFLVALWLRVRSERWKVTSRRIEHQTGILSRKVTVLDLWRVKDITYTQTLTDRLFGEGRITLLSSDATDPLLTLRGLPGHKQLFDDLTRSVSAARAAGRALAVEAT